MKELNPAEGMRLINSGPVVIVTCGPAESPNATTIAWTSVVSRQPPLVAVSIALKHFSHELILEHRCFVINVPSRDQLGAVMACGTKSGREGDKFAAAGITPLPAATVPTVFIRECPGRLECEVFKTVTAGDHKLVIGQVTGAFADEEAFDGHWNPSREKGRTLHHLGGPYFGILGERIKYES